MGLSLTQSNNSMKMNQVPANGQRHFRAGRRAFVLTSLAALLALLQPGRLSAQYVHFADTNLEHALSVTLGVPVGSITTNEMLGLTFFNGSWQNIQDTTGLQTAQNLTQIYLDGAPLTNFDGLAQLSKLTTLLLYDCQLTDVSFLTGLTNLTYLELSYNAISNAAPISNLTLLSYLGLAYNPLSDISPLTGLASLKTLSLYGDQIASIPPLNNLTNLTHLELSENPALTNASNLASLSSLTYLDLDDDPISDVSMLSGLANLDELYLNSTGVADLSPLIPLAQLRDLDISYSPVTNAFVLSNLTGLNYLSAESIGLTDATFVANLAALGNLDLGWNQLSDAGFLSQLSQLYDVEMDGNQLTSLPNLAGLTSLETLALDDNQLTNIDAVSGVASLQDLSLEANQLTTLPPLAGLINLTSLNLYANPLTTLAGLSGLTNLDDLEMSDINTLTNFDVLGQLTALQSLDAESSGLSDLAPLATLTNLNSLYLNDDDVGDVEPLGNLTNLTGLSLYGNVLASIDALTNPPSLNSLDVRYNLIDFSSGSHNANDLQFLESEVDWVYYEPQDSPLPQFGIVAQPADQTVAAGSTATFSVTVSSSISPLQYQWQFQDADLPGQTTNTLTLPAVQTTQAGRYRVRVTDNTVSGRHIYSRTAQLVVQGGGGPTAPDLTVTGSVSVSPNPIEAGDSLTVGYTVLNQGNGDAPVSHTLIQVNPGSSSASAVQIVHSTPAIPAGSSIAENVTVPIPASTPAGAYTVYVTLDYDNAIGQSDTNNDTAQTAIGALTILPPLTLAEAVNAPNLAFTTGGDAPWFVEYTNTYNGAAAAIQSGHIGYNQASWLSTTVTGPGTLSFWWNVDPDIHDVLACSGSALDSGWELYTFANLPGQWVYETIEVPSGPCTFYWTYAKHVTDSYHADAGWLDDVAYTSHLPVITISSQQWEYPGMSCTVTSSVSGASIDSFQWYLNGAPVSGGSLNGYGPFTATYANAGSYSLVVSNTYGAVTNSVNLVVAPIFYQITDLGTLWPGHYTTYTCGLNNWGDVVGYCTSNSSSMGHAWVWSHGAMTDLGDALGGGDSQAYAINDQGDIAGTARVPGTTNYDAIRWRHTGGGYAVDDLGRTNWPFAFAQAINNAGDIAFSTTDGGFYGAGHRDAYLWRQGGLLPLGGLVPPWTHAPEQPYGWTINSMGAIGGGSVGPASSGKNPLTIAWRYNGSYRDNLQSLYPIMNVPASFNVDSTEATYVNDYGDVVGDDVRSDYGAVMAAFLISDTNVLYLEEGWNSIVLGLNNHGDVTVLSEDQTSFYFSLFCSTNSVAPATLADGRPNYSDHALFALPDLLPGGTSGFESLDQTVDYSLNEAREIAGNGTFTNGENHAFLATPLPRAGNHAPVATNLMLTNFSSTLVFPISTLLNGGTDADGDTLALLTAMQSAAAGATVRRNAGNLIYSTPNTAPNTDSFSYTIMDYHGGTATGTVQITNHFSGASPLAEQLVLLNRAGSTTLIRFHGTPGQTWRIQSCDDLAGGAWTTFATAIAGPDGLIDANDVPGVNSSRFYRAVNP
jgi:internalin A